MAIALITGANKGIGLETTRQLAQQGIHVLIGSLTDQSNPESPYYGVNTAGYNSSKTAINALTVQLSKQLTSTNIKVNSACPGWVQTNMGSAAAPRTV